MKYKLITFAIAMIFLMGIANALTLQPYYKFNENLGTESSDTTGLFNLTGLNGNFTSGKLGNAFKSINTGQIDTGTTFPNTDGRFTISFWLNRTGDIGQGLNDARIINNYDGTTASTNTIFINILPDQTIQIYIPFIVFLASDIIPLNEWTFYTITYDGNDIQFYTNGNLTFHQEGTSFVPDGINLNLFNSPNHNFNSSNFTIDDLRFYNDFINQGQVDFIYNNGVGTESNLPEQQQISDGSENLIQGTGSLYSTMKSSGAGLALFLNYMKVALPLLLLGLAVVGIVIVIALGLSSVIKGFLGRK